MGYSTFNAPFGSTGSTLWGGIIPWEEVAEAISDKAERFSSTLSGAAADTSAKISPMVPAIADSLSVFCNAAHGVSKSFLQISAPWASSALQQLSILRFALVVYLGLNIMRRDAGEMLQAYENKDLDSGVSYALHGAFGMNLAIVGSASLAAEMAKLSAAAKVLSASIAGSVAVGAGLLMSASLGVYAFHGLYHARQFIKEVRGDTPHRTIAEMYADFSKLTETAQKMKRSVGPDGVSALMKELGIEDASALFDAIQKVDDLNQKENILNLVFEHNYRWQTRFVRLILISFVGAAAFTAGIVLTGGLANLLFAIGATLWLTLDANAIDQWVGDRIWEWKKDSVLPTALKIENLQMKSQFIVKVTDKEGKDSHVVQEALLKASLSKTFSDSFVGIDEQGKLCELTDSALIIAFNPSSRDFIAFDGPQAETCAYLKVNDKPLVLEPPEESYQTGLGDSGEQRYHLTELVESTQTIDRVSESKSIVDIRILDRNIPLQALLLDARKQQLPAKYFYIDGNGKICEEKDAAVRLFYSSSTGNFTAYPPKDMESALALNGQLIGEAGIDFIDGLNHFTSPENPKGIRIHIPLVYPT